MLKATIISVWAIAITVAVFAVDQLPEDNGITSSISYEEYKTETLSVALFKRGKVVGHFTTRVRYELPETVAAKFPVPVSMLIGDGLHEVAYSMEADKLLSVKERDLGGIETKLTAVLQQRKTPVPVRNLRLENTRLMIK